MCTMSKKVFLALIAGLVLTFTGCGAEDVTFETKEFEIPLSGTQILRFDIPSDWELSRNDGFCYWEFNDGDFIVQRNMTLVYTGKQEGKVYYNSSSVARNFDDVSVIISSSDNDEVPMLGTCLDDGEVITKTIIKDKKKSLQYLPEYTDYDMIMSTNGMLVPTYYDKVTSMAFTSCHSMQDDGFYTTWLMNYKFKDLQPILDTVVSCNNGSAMDSYFQNDDVYFAKMGDLVVGAKKLTYNKWCCFMSSNNTYENYVLKALYLVEDGE